MYIKTSNQPKVELGCYDWSCNWGNHIAGLYENDEERDEIILNYLCRGIRDKDIQYYCPVEQTQEEFITKIIKMCPDCENAINDPDIVSLSTARELYYPDGYFSPIAMDKGLNEFYEISQKKGPRNVRATAEMVWALEDVPGRENLMAYESRLNYFIPGKPWISICMYNIKKFDGATIMDVLRTHPYTISKGVLTENPYFIDPDDWLRDNAPQFLNENIYK